MVQSFEDFLKKKLWFRETTVNEDDWKIIGKEPLVGYNIQATDLGEWAWQKSKEHESLCIISKARTDYSYWLDCWAMRSDFEIRLPYLSIAVSCLGKKEIEKRLKTLGGVKND